MISVELPWPSKNLHPNARVHWAVRARETMGHRRVAHLLTTAAARTIHPDAWPARIQVRMTFYPPANRRRDRDGLISNCKAYLDGMADALGVNDERFDIQPPQVLDWMKQGKVIVEIGQ